MNIQEILDDDEKLTSLAEGVFLEIDVNNSGTIDRSELRNSMILINRETGMAPPTEAEIDAALKVADSDGSGLIDFNEFKISVRKILEALKST